MKNRRQTMTETQRKFLTEYLGEQWWHVGVRDYLNRTFTTAQDKQDLLEKVIENGEWVRYNKTGFAHYLKAEHQMKSVEGSCSELFTTWLIQLSPEQTAELICRWKGVE